MRHGRLYVHFEVHATCIDIVFGPFAGAAYKVSATLDKVQMATEDYFAGIRRTVFSFDEVSKRAAPAAAAAAAPALGLTRQSRVWCITSCRA